MAGNKVKIKAASSGWEDVPLSDGWEDVPDDPRLINKAPDYRPSGMDLQNLGRESELGKAGAEIAASIAVPAVTAFSGYAHGALPGDLGDAITPDAVDKSSLVYRGSNVAGFLNSPVYRGLSNLLAKGAGKLLPYASKTIGAGEGAIVETAPSWGRRLARNAISGGGYGAAEESGTQLGNALQGKEVNLAAIPAATVYGAGAGAIPGALVERGAQYLQKERVPQKIAELGWRGAALTGAKKSNPSQSPSKSMLELNLSGSPVSVGDDAAKVRAESGANVQDSYNQIFNEADKFNFKLNVFDVVSPILKKMDALYKSGTDSAQETIAGLGRYADRIMRGASGDRIGLRELHQIVESEKNNLATKGERGVKMFAERQPGQPTPTDLDAARMIISHGSQELKRAARAIGQASGNPSLGRTLEANLDRYGKSKDVQRFAQDVEAERSGKMVGDVAARVGRMVFRPGPSSYAGELLNRATRPPAVAPQHLSPFKSPTGPAAINSVQDPIRMLNVGIQNGTVSPEQAGQYLLEFLNRGSGQ